MSNAWFRMYAEFATDPKVQSMSEALQRRYVMLLCMKCNGDLRYVTESNGEVALRITATALRITEEEALETYQELLKFGLILENWDIKNWQKRQYISDIKDPSNNQRQARYRERKRNGKSNGSVTVKKRPDTDTDTDTDKKKEITKVISKEKLGSRFTLTQPPDDWIQFCVKERPELNSGIVFEGFRDYWLAKAGKDGRKADWFATWRNWVRNQKSTNGTFTNHAKPTKDDRAKAAILRGFASFQTANSQQP